MGLSMFEYRRTVSNISLQKPNKRMSEEEIQGEGKPRFFSSRLINSSNVFMNRFNEVGEFVTSSTADRLCEATAFAVDESDDEDRASAWDVRGTVWSC